MNKNLRLLLVIAAAVLLVAGLVGAKSSRHARGAWLGISMQTVDDNLAEAFDLGVDYGVIVNAIADDSPADDAGLKEEDIIIKLDGHKVWESGDLDELLEDYDAGDKVDLVILRDGKEMTVTVELDENNGNQKYWRSATPGAGYRVDVVRPPNVPDIPRVARAPRIVKMSNHRGYLGVSLSGLSNQLGEYFGVTKGRGALITEIAENSPAEAAGLMAGDVIVEIEGEKIADINDVTNLMEDFEEGDKIDVTVVRNKSEKTVNLEVGEFDYDDNLFGALKNGNFNFNFDSNFDFDDFAWSDDDVADYYYDAKNKYFDSKEARDELRQAMKELQSEMKELKKSDLSGVQKEMKKLQKELEELRKKID